MRGIWDEARPPVVSTRDVAFVEQLKEELLRIKARGIFKLLEIRVEVVGMDINDNPRVVYGFQAPDRLDGFLSRFQYHATTPEDVPGGYPIAQWVRRSLVEIVKHELAEALWDGTSATDPHSSEGAGYLDSLDATDLKKESTP